jgi:outer membrane protein assembly factor BamA
VNTRYYPLLAALTLLITFISLTATPPNVHYGETLATLFNKDASNQQSLSIAVDKISYTSDIAFDKHEFSYLVGLQPSSFITQAQIEKACKRLLLKRRFNHITVDLLPESHGENLHFILASAWLVKKIDLEGIWFGKEQYLNLYLLQPGDIFDANLHDESLKNIRHYLHDQGYLASTITDEIEYQRREKTLVIHLKLKKQRAYTITKASAIFVDLQQQQKKQKNNDIASITRAITSKLQRALEDRLYTKKRVTKVINTIKKALRKSGFINPRFVITRHATTKQPQVALTFKIRFGKRKVITVEGNKAFSSATIKDDFIGNDLPDQLFYADIIMQQILHEYYKRGYWHTSISSQPIGDIGHCLTIKEGTATIISSVEIIDAETKTPERTCSFLHNLLKDKICDQTTLATSLEHLKNFYIDQGYWDFTFAETEFIKNKTPDGYTLKVVVRKGMQRLWGGCAIPNHKDLEHDDFFKKFHLNGQDQKIPFNINWLQEQRLFLVDYFQKQGYWYADVQPKLTQLPSSSVTTSKIFVTWQVNKGHQIKFGKTIIRGTTTVKFDHLKKQLACKEGELWNRKKLAKTRNRLKRLDIFRTVNIQSHHLVRGHGNKPTIITVVDDDPVELRARLGYFTNSKNVFFKHQATPKVGASLIIKNPTNRADRLSTSGDWTKFESKFACDYQIPSPCGFSGMGTCGIFANRYTNPVEINNSGAAYHGYNYGIYADAHDEYKENYQWHFKVGNEWEKITRKQGNLKFDENLMHQTLPYFLIEPRLTIDTLDSHTNTTKGTYTNVLVKLMVPESKDSTSAKLQFEQALFLPVSDKCIIAGRVRLGHIFKDKFERILPLERFYLGGPYSVRGYEVDSLPPLGYSEDGKVTTVQGGGSMFNANLELRIPLYKSFGLVLFQDVGVLSQSGFLGFKERWYPGTGLGFRYKTPIGSIRFDLGWKWKKRFPEDTRSLAWYLTLGEAF